VVTKEWLTVIDNLQTNNTTFKQAKYTYTIDTNIRRKI